MNTSRLYDNDQNGFALPLVFLILFLMSLMMIVVFRMTQTSFTLTVKTEKLHAAQHHALDGLIYFEDQLLRALSNSHTTLPSDADADDIKNALATLIDAIIAPDHLPAGAPFTFQPPQWQASQEGRSILMTLTSEGIDAHPSERRLTRTYLFSLATRPLFYTIAASGLTIKNDVVIDGQVYVGPLSANDQNTGTIQIAYTNDQKPSIYGTLTTTLSSFQLISPPVRPPLNQACRINPNTYALREDCLSLAFDTPPSLQKKLISFDRIPIEDNVLRAYLNKNSLNTEPLCEYDKTGNCKRLLDIHLLRSEQAAYSHGLRVQNVRLSSGTMLTVDGDLIIEGDLTIEEGAQLTVTQGGRIWVAGDANIEGKKNLFASIQAHDNDGGRKDHWIYVGKNARFKNAEILGWTWYVQNNLTVDEALQTPELITYINGNTRVKKIKKTIHNSRIIIFSNGNIEEIKFDESAPNEPLMIDAYLYTNGNLSIKADRSAQIVIHGGLFAQGSIILDSKPANKKPPKKKNDALQHAYLSIVHNPELIHNPPHGAEEMTLNKMTVKVVKTE